MALSQGMIDTYWRRYNQRRALTGLPSSYQEQRGALDSIMEATANKDLREAELRFNNQERNRQLSLQEEQAKKADRAATVSGVTGLASLGASSYLGYKALTKAPSAMEKAYTSYITANTPGAVAPSVTAGATGAGVGSGGAGVLSGAGSGGSTAYTGATGTAAYGAAEGSGAAGVLGAEGATGLGATSLLGAAGAGALGGSLLGPTLDKILPGGGKTGKAVGAAAGGALTGAAAGMATGAFAGPVGAVVGGIVGGAVSLIEDSVICSELLRQKRITERDRTKCVVFRFRHIDDDMFMAYLEWAKPHVEAMRKGGWRNWIRLPFAHAFVGYMIAIQEKRYTTFIERTAWNYAWRRCEKIANRNEQYVGEVA